MAFTKTVQVKGDKQYSLHPEIKKFSVRDAGFIQNPNSKAWTYTTVLQPSLGFENSSKLKIVINDELDGMKITIVNANENMNVDIFSNPEPAVIEQYEFAINFLEEKKIIEVVE